MPRNKKGQNREELGQRPVHSFMQKMLTHNTSGVDDNPDSIWGKLNDKDLRAFLVSEYGKTNENIKRVDSRLSLIEEKLDKVEQTNRQLPNELEIKIPVNGRR